MRPATIAAVVVAGMAIVLVLTARNTTEHGHDATIEGVAAPIAEIRREAWRGVPATAEATLRDRIVTRLAAPDTTDGTLADAARGCFERGWPIHASHAIAAGELGDGEVFLAWFDEVWTADPGVLADVTSAIRTLVSMDTPSGRTLLERLLHVPDAQVTAVARVLDVPDAPLSTRLALGRRGVPSGSIEDRTDAVRSLLATPTTDDVRVLDLAPVWALAAAGGDVTTAALDARAAAGDAEAARAIGLADRDRVVRAERSVLADHAFPFERRTLAAFRLLDRDAPPGDATLLNLLDDGPADRDGTVHAAALLAARGLSPTALDRLTARWLDSDHDDQRRAAVVLAATRHARGDSIDADTIGTDVISRIDRLAIDADADARVRRTAKHASRVLGRWPHDDLDATAYAARTTRLDDGRLDPDAVLLGILAGDPEAPRRLGEAPRLDGAERRADAFAAEIAWRRAILSSLAPDRLASIGEPIPGDEADLRLWIAAIEADRLVSGPIGPPIGPSGDASFAEPGAAGETLRP